MATLNRDSLKDIHRPIRKMCYFSGSLLIGYSIYLNILTYFKHYMTLRVENLEDLFESGPSFLL